MEYKCKLEMIKENVELTNVKELICVILNGW